MTSWVISIFLRSTPPFGSSARNGTSEPKASECITTRTYGSRPSDRERSKRSRSADSSAAALNNPSSTATRRRA